VFPSQQRGQTPARNTAIDELREIKTKDELKDMHLNAVHFRPTSKWPDSRKKIALLHMKMNRRMPSAECTWLCDNRH